MHPRASARSHHGFIRRRLRGLLRVQTPWSVQIGGDLQVSTGTNIAAKAATRCPRDEGRRLATKGTKSTKGRSRSVVLPFVPFVANLLPSLSPLRDLSLGVTV